MGNIKRDKHTAWILAAALFCGCSTGMVRGEEGTDHDAAGGGPDWVSAPVASPAPSPAVTPGLSPALRDTRYYLESTWSFRNVLEAGFIAGVPNLTTAPSQPQAPSVIDLTTAEAYENEMDQYSAGMDNWRRSSEDELRYRARRFSFGLATVETRDLLSNFVLPMALRQDPRYVSPSLESSTASRLGFAAESVVVTHSNSGRLVPNFSKLAGTAGAALIAKHFYANQLGVPELNTNQFMYRYIGYSLAGDAATNVARELLRSSVKQDLLRMDAEGNPTEDNYYPLSTSGTLLYWARSTYAPRNFISGALMAGVPNVQNQPAYPTAPTTAGKAEDLAYAEAVTQYATAMNGWRQATDEDVRYHARRFVAGMSESETQQFLNNCFLPLALRMDPRYIPASASQSAGARLGSAFAEIAVSRTNSGSRMVNLPLLGGTVGGAYVAQQLYYSQMGVPELATNRLLVRTVGFNLGGDLLLNIIHEFLPHQGI